MIQGTHTYLRALEPADVELLYRWENDPVNWRVSQTLLPFSKHILTQFVKSPQDLLTQKQARFIVTRRENSQPIGTLDFFEYDPINQRAGLGILIVNEERGKGHAYEALKLAQSYAFDHLMLKTVFCNIMEDNAASLALFKKAGYKEVGLKQDWIRTPEGWKGEYLLQIKANG